MITLATKNGDLFLDKDGNLATCSGIECLAQVITEKIRLVKGEYFLDLERGTDYFGSIFIVGVNGVEVKRIIDNIILSFDEVTSLEYSEAMLDHVSRKFSYVAIVKTIHGTTGVNING